MVVDSCSYNDATLATKPGGGGTVGVAPYVKKDRNTPIWYTLGVDSVVESAKRTMMSLFTSMEFCYVYW